METIIENLRELYKMNKGGFDAILKPFGLTLVSDGDSFYSATSSGPAPVRTVREYGRHSAVQFTALSETGDYYVDFAVKFNKEFTPFINRAKRKFIQSGETMYSFYNTSDCIAVVLTDLFEVDFSTEKGVRVFVFCNALEDGPGFKIHQGTSEISPYLLELEKNLPGFLDYVKREIPALIESIDTALSITDEDLLCSSEAAKSSVGRTIQPVTGGNDGAKT